MGDFKYIFFDVANTLLYKPLLFSRILETLKDYNIETDIQILQTRHKLLAEIIKFPSETSKEFYRYFNSELLVSLGVIPNDEIVAAIFNNCKYLLWERFEDTEILDMIPIPIGIISDWDMTLDSKLSVLFNIKFFKIIISKVVGYSKPDHIIYRKAIEDLPCKPEEVLYVGDSIKLDIKPATDLGITSILIDRDDIFPNFTGNRIRSLYDLADYLKLRN